MSAQPTPSRLRVVETTEYDTVLRGFRERLSHGPRLERHLAGVVADTLDHPGSLVRAQLAHAILRDYGVGPKPALDLAIAVEYFHTASLLFDDMPAMDDAMERRGHGCPHIKHGEAATTLAALGFINRGYALLWGVIGPLPESRRAPATELVSRSLGLAGILDGQAHDLHFAEGPRTPESVLRVASGKTVPLIRLTLVLPALVGGACDDDLQRLESLSVAWGLSYQILDDFKDRVMGDAEVGKSTQRDVLLDRPNLLRTEDSNSALKRLDRLLLSAEEDLRCLTSARGAHWTQLERLHDRLTEERRMIGHRLASMHA